MSDHPHVAGMPRRSILRGLGVAAMLASMAGMSGCESGTTPAAAPPPALPDPDIVLRDQLIAAITDQSSLVAAAVVAVPALAPSWRRWEELHAEQLRVLCSAEAISSPTALPSASPSTSASPVELPSQRPLVVRRVLRGERQLATTLAEAVLTARSGTLARVLASAAAGLDQHLAAARLGRAPEDS